ncbi:hypothetical protein EON68_04730 [archaeon]|nr:MAG: hypothetical protein EON68_04730 [archaeon]
MNTERWWMRCPGDAPRVVFEETREEDGAARLTDGLRGPPAAGMMSAMWDSMFGPSDPTAGMLESMMADMMRGHAGSLAAALNEALTDVSRSGSSAGFGGMPPSVPPSARMLPGRDRSTAGMGVSAGRERGVDARGALPFGADARLPRGGIDL